MKSGEGN